GDALDVGIAVAAGQPRAQPAALPPRRRNRCAAASASQQGLEAALDQPLTRIMEQVRLALDSSQTTPDVIYLTCCSPRGSFRP
ncbi:hypothetical protein FK521_27230, partial [Klebsiella pneumoniae]|nr:hypothetical protein [Klebsiella pneumoniae]